MKQNQNPRHKGRARSTSRSKPVSRSNNNNARNGNNHRDNRAKGNPRQLLDKYKTQAREAAQLDDRVQEEYYLQFADHYQRVVNELTPVQKNKSNDSDSDAGDENTEDGSGENKDNNQNNNRNNSRHNNRNNNRNNNRDNNRGRGRHNNQDRKPQGDNAAVASIDPADQAQPTGGYPEEMLKEIPAAVKVDAVEKSAAETTAVVVEEKPKPKRRGRPKKVVSVEAAPTLPLGDSASESSSDSGGDEAA